MAAKKAVKSAKNKVITVGILGRAAEVYALSTSTTAGEIANKLGISFTRVEAAKSVDGDFVEVKAESVVNGYAAILFTPEVSGGRA